MKYFKVSVGAFSNIYGCCWWRHRSLAPSLPSLSFSAHALAANNAALLRRDVFQWTRKINWTSFSVESSAVRRAVHGISFIHTTLYTVWLSDRPISVLFSSITATLFCASFLASSSWNTHLVQQQRVWGEYVEFIQTWAILCFCVRLCDCFDVWSENFFTECQVKSQSLWSVSGIDRNLLNEDTYITRFFVYNVDSLLENWISHM